MSELQRFHDGFVAATGRTFTGKCFRIVALETYLGAPEPWLLYDLGPRNSRYGQRFSPPGDYRGLYVGTDLMTAGSEFADGEAAWLDGDCAKHVTFDIDVNLSVVLDLTDTSVVRALETSLAEVQSSWLGYAELHQGAWPLTWHLDHEAFVSREFDGIRFPSVKRVGGSCLLIFTERFVDTGGRVVVHHQDGSVWERLP